MRHPDTPPSSTTRAYRFPDVERGKAAVREMRGCGFMLDVTGSEDGEFGITIRTMSDRFDELDSIAEAHGGETPRS